MKKAKKTSLQEETFPENEDIPEGWRKEPFQICVDLMVSLLMVTGV